MGESFRVCGNSEDDPGKEIVTVAGEAGEKFDGRLGAGGNMS